MNLVQFGRRFTFKELGIPIANRRDSEVGQDPGQFAIHDRVTRRELVRHAFGESRNCVGWHFTSLQAQFDDSQQIDKVAIRDEAIHQLGGSSQHFIGVLARGVRDHGGDRTLNKDPMIVGLEHFIVIDARIQTFEQTSACPGLVAIIRDQETLERGELGLVTASQHRFGSLAPHPAVLVL